MTCGMIRDAAEEHCSMQAEGLVDLRSAERPTDLRQDKASVEPHIEQGCAGKYWSVNHGIVTVGQRHSTGDAERRIKLTQANYADGLS